jgi:hypothetical protein
METAYGYFPDLYVRWGMTLASTHFGETAFTEAGRRQSMNFGPQELRTFTAQFLDEPPPGVAALTGRQIRAIISDFNSARGGAHGQSFNFWNPIPGYKNYPGVSVGTAAAQSTFIIPWRITNAGGGVTGQIYDVRVVGVSQTFTIRHLLPSPRSFASLRFDGLSGQLLCGSQSSLRALGDQAIGAWVWRGGGAAGPIAGNATANASGVQLEITAGGVVRFITNQAGAQVIATCPGAVVPLNTHTHIFAVKSGTTVTFYINGVVNGAAQTGITNPIVATSDFRIGGNANAAFFDGMIGHVRYYNSAPSASEILNIYSGNHTPTSNLKGWWRLDEGYGTAVADISGSTGNGGTVNGTAPWVAGHEEIVFSGGAQTGAVTAALYGRELMVCGFGSEPLTQTFVPTGGDVRSAFALIIQERY